MEDWLGLAGRTVLVCGLSNRRSVAWAVGSRLEEAGARVLYSVRTAERREELGKLLAGRPCYVCDVAEPEAAVRLAEQIPEVEGELAGLVHSIAFADFGGGVRPFHETEREAFLSSVQVSAFSLVELARALRPRLARDASVVAMGISTTELTAENYGYLAPIKGMLEANARHLAKSFSAFSEVRFNTVNAGPLKTKSSAGIPGYLENYLYAEKLTLRKRAVTTGEVADAAVYLLSPRSSGINGQGLVVNAGMDFNYFDREVVEKSLRGE